MGNRVSVFVLVAAGGLVMSACGQNRAEQRAADAAEVTPAAAIVDDTKNSDPPSVAGPMIDDTKNSDPPSAAGVVIDDTKNSDPPSAAGVVIDDTKNSDPPTAGGAAIDSK